MTLSATKFALHIVTKIFRHVHVVDTPSFRLFQVDLIGLLICYSKVAPLP